MPGAAAQRTRHVRNSEGQLAAREVVPLSSLLRNLRKVPCPTITRRFSPDIGLATGQQHWQTLKPVLLSSQAVNGEKYTCTHP